MTRGGLCCLFSGEEHTQARQQERDKGLRQGVSYLLPLSVCRSSLVTWHGDAQVQDLSSPASFVLKLSSTAQLPLVEPDALSLSRLPVLSHTRERSADPLSPSGSYHPNPPWVLTFQSPLRHTHHHHPKTLNLGGSQLEKGKQNCNFNFGAMNLSENRGPGIATC